MSASLVELAAWGDMPLVWPFSARSAASGFGSSRASGGWYQSPMLADPLPPVFCGLYFFANFPQSWKRVPGPGPPWVNSPLYFKVGGVPLFRHHCKPAADPLQPVPPSGSSFIMARPGRLVKSAAVAVISLIDTYKTYGFSIA